MGEARRREESDPSFGKIPKDGKGIIISNPMSVNEESFIIRSGKLDPIELRRALLYWDRIAWPTSSALHVASDTDVQYLEDMGKLERPRHSFQDGQLTTIVRDTFLAEFANREAREPGQWALSQGHDSIILSSGSFAAGRGLSVELYRAIPTPNENTPLEDLLSFRERRIDQVRALTIAMDQFFSRCISAGDQAQEIALVRREIDMACAAVIRVAKEAQLPFSLSSWKFGVSINPISIAGASLMGLSLGQSYGLAMVGALIGGAVSTITINKDIGKLSDSGSLAPFRFVVDVEKGIF